MAKRGDLIVINARRVGGPPRVGEILEVLEGELRVQYRIRWSDGHESVFAPAPGTTRIERARNREKTGPEQVDPKKSPAKASPAKRSMPAKSASKKASAKRTTDKKSPAKASTARRSTARKVGSKKAASGRRTGSPRV